MARLTARAPEGKAHTIARLVANGNDRYVSAAFAEVGAEQFDHWIDRDRSFRRLVEKSEAEAELRAIAALSTAAESDWKAAAARLEIRREQKAVDDLRRLRELTSG